MVSLLLAVIYLAFISLGLPDALLGSAWPVMQGALNAPLSFAGAVSMVISGGTILSSLLSDRMTRKLGVQRPVDADPLGCSLRSGGGRGGRGAEQLRGAALFLPAHELAALHVGRRRQHQPVYYEPGPAARLGLADGLPLGLLHSAGPDGAAVSQSAPLEKADE